MHDGLSFLQKFMVLSNKLNLDEPGFDEEKRNLQWQNGSDDFKIRKAIKHQTIGGGRFQIGSSLSSRSHKSEVHVTQWKFDPLNPLRYDDFIHKSSYEILLLPSLYG